MNLADKSLEDFIDCQLFESTFDEDAEASMVEPLPPPPLPEPAPAPVPMPAPVEVAAAPIAITPAPIAPMPEQFSGRTYVENVVHARPWRKRAAIAIAAFAAAVVIATIAWIATRGHDQPRTVNPPTAARRQPIAPSHVVPAPQPTTAIAEPARAPTPTAKQPAPAPLPPTLLVLVQSSPSNANVTYGGHLIGTTPTYVRVPSATPSTIEVSRGGWKSQTQTVTATHVGDRVTVRLEPNAHVAARPTPAKKRPQDERPPI